MTRDKPDLTLYYCSECGVANLRSFRDTYCPVCKVYGCVDAIEVYLGKDGYVIETRASHGEER